MMINPELKITTLLTILSKYQYKKAIVYFPTCTSVKHFYQIFNKVYQQESSDEPLKFFHYMVNLILNQD